MSLMNDALRKKQSEKKHPSGADFLKTDSEPKTNSNFKMVGLVILGILICAVGGYFGYEYYSLSRPIAPRQPAPLVAATAPLPSHTEKPPEEKNSQAAEPLEPVETAAPIEQKSATPATEFRQKS